MTVAELPSYIIARASAGLAGLLKFLQQAWWRWRLLSRRQQIMAGGGALAVILALGILSYRASRGCSSREAVEGRVALITAELQQAASNHKISVPELAERIKRLNEAASLYTGNHDSQAYCAVLNELGDQIEL